MEFSKKFYLVFDREESKKETVIWFTKKGTEEGAASCLFRRHITPILDFDDFESADKAADKCEHYAKDCLNSLYRDDAYNPLRKAYFRVYAGDQLNRWADTTKTDNSEIIVHDSVSVTDLPIPKGTI